MNEISLYILDTSKYDYYITRDIILKKITKNNLDYTYGKYGKPYIKDFYFNISRSGNLIVCAVSDNEIGISLEQICPVNIDIAKKYFCESEYNSIISINDNIKEFYRYWTLKESFIKKIGYGMHLPFNNFEIIIKDNKISINEDITKYKNYFYEINIPGYLCSICSSINTNVNVINLN